MICKRCTQDLDEKDFSPSMVGKTTPYCRKCFNVYNSRLPARWQRLRVSAERRGIEFLLSKEELGQLLAQPCIYGGGTELIGIDRKNSSKGYVKSNCVPCCRKHNDVKRDWFSVRQMKRLLKAFPHLRQCGDRGKRKT